MLLLLSNVVVTVLGVDAFIIAMLKFNSGQVLGRAQDGLVDDGKSYHYILYLTLFVVFVVVVVVMDVVAFIVALLLLCRPADCQQSKPDQRWRPPSQQSSCLSGRRTPSTRSSILLIQKKSYSCHL